MPTAKKTSLTLLTCTFLLALTGCPASDPPGQDEEADSQQAVMSSPTESGGEQQKDGMTVHRRSSENQSSGGSPMQGGPPAPGAPDPSKVEWTDRKYLPDGWPQFLPLPDDAEYQTREFDSDTGTGRLKFSTLMGGGKLKVTYRDNLKENDYELDNLVPRKNSYLRKFKKGDRAIYVLVYDPQSKPNHRMVELRVTEDSGEPSDSGASGDPGGNSESAPDTDEGQSEANSNGTSPSDGN